MRLLLRTEFNQTEPFGLSYFLASTIKPSADESSPVSVASPKIVKLLTEHDRQSLLGCLPNALFLPKPCQRYESLSVVLTKLL